jgi:hypothetical protein
MNFRVDLSVIEVAGEEFHSEDYLRVRSPNKSVSVSRNTFYEQNCFKLFFSINFFGKSDKKF